MIVKHGTHTNKSMGPRLYNLLSYNERFEKWWFVIWIVLIPFVYLANKLSILSGEQSELERAHNGAEKSWGKRNLQLSLKGFHLHYGKYIQMAENFPSLSLVPSFVGHSFNYLKRHPLVKNLLANWLRNTKNGCYFWLKICSTY